MKEEWLFPGAFVPVDVETTSALVAEVKRLIDVVGGLVLKQGPDYERGFIDGMQKQMQSSVDKAVNAMAQPEQEPVAWGVFDHNLHDMFFAKEEAHEMVRLKGDGSTVKPLYTTPPQRTWVGLTDEEASWCQAPSTIETWKRIEDKLKEKNT